MKIGITLQPNDAVLDGRHLVQLTDIWLTALEADGVTPYTVAGYRNKLAHFTTWWAAIGPGQDWELRRRDLQAFGRWLETVKTPMGAPLAYNTRRDVLRRLQQLLRWAFATDRLPMDLSKWVTKATGGPPKRRAMTLDELERLLDAGATGDQPVRDRAIIALFIGSGMRRSELAGLNTDDITFDAATNTGLAVVRGKRTTANATGERTVVLDAATVGILRPYLHLFAPRDGEPLFFWTHGAERLRIGPNGIYRIVRRAARRAGLGERMKGAHDLRRAFATLMTKYLATHDAELSADMVRRQLGHSSYSMTAFYAKLEPDDLSGVMHSPLTLFKSPVHAQG